DGPLRTRIEEKSNKLKLQENVIFLGSRNDVANLCQIMDIFIFPSIYEGFPVTLVEAQAAGIKIFASDAISKEVKITNNLIFLSLHISPEIWAKTIFKSIPYKKKNTDNLIKQMGYDIKTNAKNLQNFYLENK